ncbi:hypothetical protein LN040_00130 [Desulfovibrio subterraneus]|uniref:hypothetical protein n=1 Tax=Desulfovibrio subterraneus TaxID=2718620 RepID=UPI0022B8C00B|nr:hypothetical protein [Desulfovibrio subterraneus]WBF67551.1 hypothetical protein LN040_00130 [Desulfovibrio subterraneus]
MAGIAAAARHDVAVTERPLRNGNVITIAAGQLLPVTGIDHVFTGIYRRSAGYKDIL